MAHFFGVEKLAAKKDSHGGGDSFVMKGNRRKNPSRVDGRLCHRFHKNNIGCFLGCFF